jgi:hypothetical protein
MDFKIPDILSHSDFDNEHPRNLRQMGELLKISYEALNHPILKRWSSYSAIDPFLNIESPEYYKRFNRTVIERTITQAEYFSQMQLDYGVLTMKSKGIEVSIESVKSFLLTANKIYQSKDIEKEELGINIHAFRLVGSGELTASIKFFMEVCNNLIALTQKHFIQNRLTKLEKDEDKVKYLLRAKASLLHQQDQYDEKTFAEIINSVQVELDYHKELKSYFEISEELMTIIEQFLAEKKARIANHQLLAYLLQGNINMFCEELRKLVMQLFSYHDIAGNEPEKVYHAFLLGLLNSFRDDFELESNKEAGKGRFDVMLIPNTQDYSGVIIEVKRSRTSKLESINTQLADALSQIVNNQYAVELQKRGHKKYFGIAAVFVGKELFLQSQSFNVNEED